MSEIKDRAKDWLFILNSTEKGEYPLKYNPLEYASTEYGLDRNTENDGIFFTFSGDYTYLKDGYDYIKDGLNKYGILWECTLTIKTWNHQTSQLDTIINSKKLDFTSRPEKSNDNGINIAIPLKDSGFYTKIKAYENEEIPYGRLEALDGTVITPYTNEYELVNILGYELFSENVITIIDSGSQSTNIIYPSITNSNTQPYWIGTVLTYSDGTGSGGPGPYDAPSEEWVEARTFFKPKTIKGNFKGTINIEFETGQTANNTFILLDFKTLINPVRVAEVTKFSSGFGPATQTSFDVDYDFDSDTRLVLYCGSSFAFVQIYTTASDIEILDKKDPTDINHVSLWQAHDRLVTAMTGQADSFRSSVLEPGGEWGHMYSSNGYLYRQFDTDESQLSFKWKELTENCAKSAMEVGYGLIEENGKKIIICEKKEYFYQDSVVAVVNKNYKQGSFTRNIDIDQYYSAISGGTPKKDYEQAGGLIDYTTEANYTTILGVLDNLLDLVLSYQISGNWVEAVRRLVKDETETTDSKYDNDVVLMETIVDGVLIQRTKEDFDTVTGIDDITTPVNLNLTPGRQIQRHGKWIKTGLELYPTSKIKFNKSEILTTLSTVRSDESIEIFENKDIVVSTLDPRKFTGDIIEVLADVTIEDIANTEASPYEKWQITDEITGLPVQGWILKLSTKPIGESLTNITILEAATVTPILTPGLWNSGESIIWITGESIDWNA